MMILLFLVTLVGGLAVLASLSKAGSSKRAQPVVLAVVRKRPTGNQPNKEGR